MPTIQITVSESEKKDIDHLFRELGMTTSSATKVFYKQALREHGLPFTPKIKHDIHPIVIKPKITEDGTLIIPDDAPEDVKEWVKNG